MMSGLLGVGGLVIFGFFSLFFVGFAWAAELRFAGELSRPRRLRWLVRWSIQGLLLPWFLWGLMNVGVSFDIGSYMPQLQVLAGRPEWLLYFMTYFGAGCCLIASYWCALTLGWVIWRSRKGLEGEVKEHFRGLCTVSLGVMTLPAIGLLWLGGWYTGGLAISAMLMPIAGYGPSLLHPRKMPPMYAKAIAKVKFGKYSEAEEEVIRQLERRQDDYDGWMMLAELYATQFNDVAEAEQTILEVCDQPRTTPGQVSVALHKLADWHLKYNCDPDAAKRALEVIRSRMPDTHLARMAEKRIKMLPNTPEEWREQQINKPVYLPALHDPLDEGKAESMPKATPPEAIQRAAELDKRLITDPDDVMAREELARLCAGSLGKPDQAIAHMEKLLTLPNQTMDKRASWLGLIATWQLEGLQEREKGRETLRQLIREFPESTMAFAAQRRLMHLNMEDKLIEGKTARPTPKFKIEVESNNSGATV